MNPDSFSVLDWILFLGLAGFCFITYVHPDILITGNRSWIVYDGITDFYDHVAAWTKDNGANYMPSTFWLFALWNLPLKLLGWITPVSVFDYRIVLCFWYKLLPLPFYVGSCFLIYRIGREIELGHSKAKLAMFAFMTAPMCFFSQFIFAQCDIFMVFFMLWGMYYFYRNQKGDMWRFALLFGVSVTFKYFPLVIFFVLLMLREKRVSHILKYTIGAVLPIGAEYLLYRGSVGFQKSVLGFGVLDYASKADFSTILSSFSYMKIGCIVMVLWAYFVHTGSKRDETAWTLYLCSGVWFVVFSFCTWHPQWLILVTPFWALSTFQNVHAEKFLWLETGLAVIVQFVVTSAYPWNVDVNLMQYLVWKKIFRLDVLWYSMSQVLPEIDRNTTYSAFVAVLLIMFLFRHPKYNRRNLESRESAVSRNLLRFRLVLTVVMFSVPAFLAAYVNTMYSQTILTGSDTITKWVELTKGQVVQQTLTKLDGDLHSISFYSDAHGRENTAEIHMEISDEEGTMVYSYVFEPGEIKDEAYTEHVLTEPFSVDPEETYTVTFYSETGKEKDSFGIGLSKIPNVTEKILCTINGKATDYTAGIKYVIQYDSWAAARARK